MIWFKRDPLLASVICAAILLIGGEGGWLWRVRTQASQAVLALNQKNRERDSWRTQSPTPSEENERAVERDLLLARGKLTEWESNFGPIDDTGFDASPAKSTNAFFEIASFVEKTRTLAEQSGVAIRSGEHFGFASYANTGPAVDVLPAVLRQQRSLRTLLDLLLSAKPTALISVQREHPAQATTPASSGDPVDFFEPVVSLLLRKPGTLETGAFKLEFTGRTRVLRDFINQLAMAKPAFATRSVEVEPIKSATISGASAKSEAAVPVITEGISQFRVVIEQLRVVTEAGGNGP